MSAPQEHLPPLQRVFRGHSSRKTRFHSGRGELMPAGAWFSLPRLLVRRVTGRSWDGPWVVPAARARLDSLIRPDWRVLELGSGASTAWYADRAAHVTSIEDDAGWLEEVRRMLAARRLDNAELVHSPVSGFADRIAALGDASLDLLVVDSNEDDGIDRRDLLRAGRDKVRLGGWVLFDDSDRPTYPGGPETVIPDWHHERFVGLKPHPLTACETSLFQRPAQLDGDLHELA